MNWKNYHPRDVSENGLYLAVFPSYSGINPIVVTYNEGYWINDDECLAYGQEIIDHEPTIYCKIDLPSRDMATPFVIRDLPDVLEEEIE